MAVYFKGMGSGLIASVKVYGVPKYPPVSTNWSTANQTPYTYVDYPAAQAPERLVANYTGAHFAAGHLNRAYVFKRAANGTASYVTALPEDTFNSPSASEGLAMSANGNRLILQNGSNPGGGLWFYDRATEQSPWVRTVQNGTASYGNSVSVSEDGSVHAFGLPSTSNGSHASVGAARIISTNPAIASASFPAPFPNSDAIDMFGKLAAISGDGRQAAFVRGGGNLSGNPTVYFYGFNGTSWVSRGVLGVPDASSNNPVRFVEDLSMNYDGTVCTMSGYRPNNGGDTGGRVYVYQRDTTTDVWTRPQMIVPPSDDNLTAMGYRNMLDRTGTILAVTARSLTFVYQRASISQPFVLRRQLFGGSWSLAISKDGGYIMTAFTTARINIFKAGE